MQYWFNVDTKQVETDETRSQDANVLGPYDSEQDASNALQRVAHNNEEWDEEDRRWDDSGLED
jgi:hypothetical protein